MSILMVSYTRNVLKHSAPEVQCLDGRLAPPAANNWRFITVASRIRVSDSPNAKSVPDSPTSH